MSDDIKPIDGVRLGVVEAGIRKSGRKDLVVIELDPHARVAAVFTRNRCCAAPVQLARQHLSRHRPRYLLINTGNANAGTGRAGLRVAQESCRALAALTGVTAGRILPFSTGVIGEPLPVERLVQGLPRALSNLAADGWSGAAEGIMTTDTRPKVLSRQIRLGKSTITITGMAKGAGMIKPNMATMLAYVATDAAVSQSMLRQLLKEAVEISFNRITVDGDTSTNDACVLISTGKAGNPLIRSRRQTNYAALCRAVQSLFIELAQAIIRDAEGASKFMTIRVEGGRTANECLAVAYAVAESPLVKTAFFASDPNWGRILAAIGRSGIANLSSDGLTVLLDDVIGVRRGARDPD